MIVWLNGTYGAGKTTTALALVERLPRARLFDSENVGQLLRQVLDWDSVTNFQEWRAWRGLTVDTARRVLDEVGGTLVIPQTVLTEEYWNELRAGFAEAGIPVHPFLLHTDRETLVERIHTDTKPESLGGTVGWRLDHLDAYEAALPWLRTAFTVLDTTGPTPEEVAERVRAVVRPEGMSDAEIEAAMVGVPRQLNGRVRLVAYDPRWPEVFAAEAARLRAALGSLRHRLEHTGSTSVPGLVAKPVVDMLLVVPDSGDEEAYVPALEPLGYRVAIREPEWHEHRVLCRDRPADDVDRVNLHVLSEGSFEVERVLAFRDRLRGHAEERELYAETKRGLAERSWKYTQNYADAKSEVVEAILARALAERRHG
ncbi:hypothetical protein EBN88_11990 [Streptomyces triticirhizae]|uniref:Uncharacterized protein n=2 Tax=Streptomyces triticirhizae TaxID=2483353 RepID=A0A3M2LVC2_9ACTN|nr:hypothetical protein EBN88_11990 [Streptomyces triticirhizae]